MAACIKCEYQHCRSKKSSHPTKCFFKIPGDSERCKAWLEAMGRYDLMVKQPNKLHSSFRVCADHFEEKYFTSILRTRLNKGAIPCKVQAISNGQDVLNKIEEDGAFLDKVCFYDEATFNMCEKVNRHNCRIWSSENPCEVHEDKRNSPKLNVWCALNFIVIFEMGVTHTTVTINSSGTEKNSLWHWDLNPGFQLYVLMLYPLSHTRFPSQCQIESSHGFPLVACPLHYVIDVYECRMMSTYVRRMVRTPLGPRKKPCKMSLKKGNYSPSKVTNALRAISDGMQIRRVSKLFGVRRTTVWNKINHKSPAEACHPGPVSMLPSELEVSLKDYILELARKGFP
ncbi:hypothetical protein ANN_00705 [Periplaneta americana]|uniref:THAP-type domain-containing protein n=1 Tax=Periplaneta americana TaxID=6978 RepID=A0ABQ8TRL6_PERAM|nr:hypothetical protein ANN_00705 [Periplaneta americana]